jgi:hypothetical protein
MILSVLKPYKNSQSLNIEKIMLKVVTISLIICLLIIDKNIENT